MSDDDTDVDMDLSPDDAVGRARSGEQTPQEEMAEQNREAITKRIDAVNYTITRIEEADADELVLQQLEGNVMVEVPPEERADLREKLVRTKEQLKAQREETTQVLKGN